MNKQNKEELVQTRTFRIHFFKNFHVRAKGRFGESKPFEVQLIFNDNKLVFQITSNIIDQIVNEVKKEIPNVTSEEIIEAIIVCRLDIPCIKRYIQDLRAKKASRNKKLKVIIEDKNFVPRVLQIDLFDDFDFLFELIFNLFENLSKTCNVDKVEFSSENNNLNKEFSDLKDFYDFINKFFGKKDKEDREESEDTIKEEEHSHEMKEMIIFSGPKGSKKKTNTELFSKETKNQPSFSSRKKIKP